MDREMTEQEKLQAYGAVIGMILKRQCDATNATEATFELKGKVGVTRITFTPSKES